MKMTDAAIATQTGTGGKVEGGPAGFGSAARGRDFRSGLDHLAFW
jgi:hypothetical protein